jgi:hypothetical protein
MPADRAKANATRQSCKAAMESGTALAERGILKGYGYIAESGNPVVLFPNASERRLKRLTPGVNPPASPPSSESTIVTFKNNTRANVKLIWMSFDNRLREYMTIPPGRAFKQQTFVKHQWLLIYMDESEHDDIQDSDYD